MEVFVIFPRIFAVFARWNVHLHALLFGLFNNHGFCRQ